MAAISTSSYLNSTSKGLSGLVSGMNTQELVDKMLAGTQAKIDKQNSAKAVLALKQGMYRDSVSLLRGLQSKFFSFTSPTTNLLSKTFFNQNVASVSSSASAFLSVEATSQYTGTDVKIDYIRQLASATKVTSAATIANANISGTFNAAVYTDKSFSVETTGGASINVNFSGTTTQEIFDSINTQLAGTGISATLDGTAFKLVSDTDGEDVKVSASSALAKQMLGISAGGTATSISGNINASASTFNLQFNLDGITKTIALDTSITDTNAFVNDINTKLGNAFGNGIKATSSGNDITFKTVFSNGTPDPNRQLTISGTTAALAATGIAGGSSTKLSLDAKLSDIPFAAGLTPSGEGDYKFNINGVDFNFTGNNSLRDVINTVNSSSAGVKMSYSSSGDIMSLERVTSGAGLNIDMSDTGGNLLGAIFAKPPLEFAASSGMKGSTVITYQATAEIAVEVSGFPPTQINIAGKTASEVVGDIQAAIRLNQAPPSANVSFDEDTGRVVITGVSTNPIVISGSTSKGTVAIQSLFGADTIEVSQGLGNVTYGKNAIISINGVETERGSNTFNLSGLNVTLKATNWDGVTALKPDAINVDVKRNTENVISGLKTFVEEYNKVIDYINGLVTSPTTYKNYPPLTTAQKNEMTDNEIKLWEEKSKIGLLRADSTLNAVMQDLRSTIYSKPANSVFGLYDFGITTSENYYDGGKLVIDEERLRSMIEQNPDGLDTLFTTPGTGLAEKLGNVLTKAASTSSINPGSLVSVAGFTGMQEQNFAIGKQMKNIDDMISRLNATYTAEKNRYWKQFNAMEQMIANMNSQSSWLASQFS